MKDEILKLKHGAKRIADNDGNKHQMTVGNLVTLYGGNTVWVSEIIEDLIDTGYLKPFGVRILPTQMGYSDMQLERTNKSLTVNKKYRS